MVWEEEEGGEVKVRRQGRAPLGRAAAGGARLDLAVQAPAPAARVCIDGGPSQSLALRLDAASPRACVTRVA